MSHNKRKEGYGIAKYFKRREEEARGGPEKDPSRMFQMNRMEGTGQGEEVPTHTNNSNSSNNNNSRKNRNEDDSGNGTDDKEKKGRRSDNTNAYVYGGTKGDRKGKRVARLGPQKIQSPQNAVPSDDEVTWGMFPPPGSKEEAKLDQGRGAASKHVPEEDGAASMGASWRAAEVQGDPTRTQVATRGGKTNTRGGPVETTTKRKDRTGKGEEEPTRRRENKEEGIKITYVNAGKHERAVEEVSNLHQADDIIIIGETPLVDNAPMEIEGYAMIANEGKPDISAYIKESRQHLIESAETSAQHVSITTTGGWKILGIYSRGQEGVESLPDIRGKKMIWRGDFNVRHEIWYDGGGRGRSSTDKKGRELLRWTKIRGMTEIGRKEHTRKQGLELPSKIDLIFTNAQATAYPPQEIANSDHCAISAKITEETTRKTTKEKANCRQCDWDTVLERMKKEGKPTTAEEFQEMMDKEIRRIPRRRGDGQNRLPADLLALRRQTRKLVRRKEKHEEYHLTRNKYRNQLKEFITARIEGQLEEADEPGVFELCKKGKRKKVMQYLTRGARVYRGRKEMAECIADHQGAGKKKEEEKEDWREIEEVAEWEVQDAAKGSPINSANGADDASLKMVLTANQAHPGALRGIFTSILRRGKHPQIWKDADVVPIPKAKRQHTRHQRVEGRYTCYE